MFCMIIRESSQSFSRHDALFCEGSCQRWYHHWCVNVSQEDYKLLADSSDPFICPACTAKKQITIIQQLQSAIQLLNTEVQDLKVMVTALQSLSYRVQLLETQKQEEGRAMQRKYHQLVKNVSCHGMFLSGGRIEKGK